MCHKHDLGAVVHVVGLFDELRQVGIEVRELVGRLAPVVRCAAHIDAAHVVELLDKSVDNGAEVDGRAQIRRVQVLDRVGHAEVLGLDVHALAVERLLGLVVVDEAQVVDEAVDDVGRDVLQIEPEQKVVVRLELTEVVWRRRFVDLRVELIATFLLLLLFSS